MDITQRIPFKPVLAKTLKNYNKQLFIKDLLSGIIVGIVALPLAIAFGIASGVSPERGLITAIIAGFLISLLGGSKVQIGGPTGAFIVIVYGIVEKFGTSGLIIATIMAGLMLFAMGALKLGGIIKFMPYPIIVGFTSGIAVTIFSTQIKDLFGLTMDSVPGDFASKWLAYFQHMDTTNLWSLGLGVISIALIFLWPKVSKKIPGSLVAIVVITLVVYILRELGGITGIETIGDRFSINASLPKPEAPKINMELITTLFPSAFTIAILGAIESLLSAMVADGVIGSKHDSNTELMAQGVANIVTPLFGGIPATGAIARTMTNINNGGRTPVAGLIHAVVLLLILLFLGPLTKYIPMACLAGVLVVVAYNMSEWRQFLNLLKMPKSDVAVLLITFFLTVFMDLTVAIEVGLILAVVLFMRRIMETSSVSVVEEELKPEEYAESDERLSIPNGVAVYEVNGPFFFGVANKFEEQMDMMGEKPIVRIIRMRKVPFIDSTGVRNLQNMCKLAKREGIVTVLSGVNSSVHGVLERSGFYGLLGEDNICPHIYAALERASVILENNPAPKKHHH
ncbi:MAG: sulfate permease [Bacteroidales bacterium]|jgi:sulfate permease, SulP family|nr:sulfate permease [Bacteroidales bacterium]